MWRDFYALVTTPPATGRNPFGREYPYYVIVEAQGGDPAGDPLRFEQALATAAEEGRFADAAIATSQSQRDAIWALRDDVGRLFGLGHPFVFDISLPVAEMEGYVAEVHRALAERLPGERCFTFGHLGDGNLHFVVVGDAGPEARRTVEEAVYRPLTAWQGSVSAEHGIGIEKRPWLSLSRSAVEIALMRRLKQALDPRGILNPGRVI
jgi:FAD/FMN-containing dehydrogenase